MQPEELTSAFEEALPETPSTRGWGKRARTRYRNRRIGAGAAAGITAVAVVAVAVQLSTATSTLIATPAETPTPTPSPVPAAADACQLRVPFDQVVTQLEDVVAGAVCAPSTEDHTRAVSVPLSPELVTDIVAEISSRDTNAGPEPGLSSSSLPSLVLLDRDGNAFTMVGYPGEAPADYRWYTPRDENGIPRWMPPIEPALEQDAVPVEIPAELIQLQKHCAAISGDFHTDDGQTSLQRQIPTTGLPDRPETAWLCLSALAVLEDPRPASAQARLEASQAQQVVDLYNNLPAATPTCQVEENAPAGLIVLDYPHQTRYLLEVRNNHCWSILTANDHRQGGQDMRDTLWELTDT